MIKLGVNIDHVATIRQARGTKYPSVVQAALRAEQAGADSITLHLREDRRHMQDADIFALRPLLQTKMNLECAVTDEMLDMARNDYVDSATQNQSKQLMRYLLAHYLGDKPLHTRQLLIDLQGL